MFTNDHDDIKMSLKESRSDAELKATTTQTILIAEGLDASSES